VTNRRVSASSTAKRRSASGNSIGSGRRFGVSGKAERLVLRAIGQFEFFTITARSNSMTFRPSRSMGLAELF
jgi:hypothetical protein